VNETNCRIALVRDGRRDFSGSSDDATVDGRTEANRKAASIGSATTASGRGPDGCLSGPKERLAKPSARAPRGFESHSVRKKDSA
jgi:hypothetical protein